MSQGNKAVKIDLFNFSTPQMRAFHMSWFSFFLCFFGWFGIAPMLMLVRDDLGITTDQIVTTNMVAVASTIFMRLFIGWLCDRIGPRLSYSILLVAGSIPVMTIGLADSYASFLLMRMAIGAIGAAFVITQYHTSVMFASNCVGTANATTAGWGNMGGGVTQMVMPMIFAAVLTVVGTQTLAWRWAMVLPGVAMFFTGIAYFFLTQDCPEGNYSDLRARKIKEGSDGVTSAFFAACTDYRVWVLFVLYGSCFGIELLVNSKAALYFADYHGMNLKTAGIIAGLFGVMNIFARTLGGYVGDRLGNKFGLNGRVRWLFLALFIEGFALIFFSRMTTVPLIVGAMIVFSLFVQMSEGATFSIVPFINKKALGAVAGIVGAGGNAGAVLSMFLFKKGFTSQFVTGGLSWPDAFLVVGVIVILFSFATFSIRFSPEVERDAKNEFEKANNKRFSLNPA